MPSDEVEHICLVQREKKKSNQIQAPLYFKDSMNPIQNDAQINYEINVLGLGHQTTNKKEG